MNNVNLAPVVLFVYNRPDHTRQTLQALKSNKLSEKTKLFVFADGAKKDANAATLEKISRVREIIHSEKWCGEVEIIEAIENKGLAQSIKEGVTSVMEKFGKVIVMEDDLITSSAFLTYMNKALDYYQTRQSVFSISAYSYPPNKFVVPRDYEYDVFVSLRNGSWGWGTWSDRWEKVDWKVSSYPIMNQEMKEALNRGGDDVFELLEGQQTGKLNIWSIQFTMAHFKNHAISILPCISYVDNIGMDGSGENCSEFTSLRNEKLNEKEDIRFLDVLYEDKRIINAFYSANCRSKRPLWKKVINKLCRTIGITPIYVIKKKIYC